MSKSSWQRNEPELSPSMPPPWAVGPYRLTKGRVTSVYTPAAVVVLAFLLLVTVGLSFEFLSANLVGDSSKKKTSTDIDLPPTNQAKFDVASLDVELRKTDEQQTGGDDFAAKTSLEGLISTDVKEDCTGRYIYAYDLPPAFNQDFLSQCRTLSPWNLSLCPAFSNAGMGRLVLVDYSKRDSIMVKLAESWFETQMYTMEIYYHRRILKHPCLTEDPVKATVFYIPFYAGIAVTRSLFVNDIPERDRPPTDLVEWLRKLPWWDRYDGRDHMMVCTRNMNSFARFPTEVWGSIMLHLSHMKNVTALSTEAHTSDRDFPNTFSVPYMTAFHPTSDVDVARWQDFLRHHKRRKVAVYLGSKRGMGSGIRQTLTSVCKNSQPYCRPVYCVARGECLHTRPVMKYYLSAHFCFQPPGDTPARKGIFDCMLAGGIPVLFHPRSAYVYTWHLPDDHESYSVYFDPDEVAKDSSIVMKKLGAFTHEELERLHSNVIDLIPRITYYRPGAQSNGKDAFDISLSNVMEKVAALGLSNATRKSQKKLRNPKKTLKRLQGPPTTTAKAPEFLQYQPSVQ